MKHKVLDTIALDHDLAEHGLRKGDFGSVVEVYEPDGLEVEFVTASGRSVEAGRPDAALRQWCSLQSGRHKTGHPG